MLQFDLDRIDMAGTDLRLLKERRDRTTTAGGIRPALIQRNEDENFDHHHHPEPEPG